MFEKYKNSQEIAIKTLTNSIEKNKLSHAYLFETNNNVESLNFILDFIKYILCEESRQAGHDEKACHICSAINTNNYLELKIINPSTMQIKKEEITSLQEEFKNKAIEGNKKIYIIQNAEKLNNSSANTILKFLEEPEENIIAILMTSSEYLIFDTIKSRCQIISLSNNQLELDLLKKIYDNIYSNDLSYEDATVKIKEMIGNICKFIEFLEKNKKDTILFSNDYFFKYFNERILILEVFEIIKLLYYDVLKYKINGKIKYFNDNTDLIEYISKLNSVDDLSNKINITVKTIEKIKYNVNVNLLLDKYIMDMGGN